MSFYDLDECPCVVWVFCLLNSDKGDRSLRCGYLSLDKVEIIYWHPDERKGQGGMGPSLWREPGHDQ